MPIYRVVYLLQHEISGHLKNVYIFLHNRYLLFKRFQLYVLIAEADVFINKFFVAFALHQY